MNETQGINALKQLLFDEEQAKYRELQRSLKELEQKVTQQLDAQKLPNSEVNAIIEQMIMVMPERLGPTITKTLKMQIRESRDEVVQTLFPIIGQMIKKYVQQELQVITEKIDRQFEEALSFDRIWLKIKAFFLGASYHELVLKSTNEPQIKEIFVIEEESGILMGSYSKSPSFDQDMMAGMLTAIKSFVEDAMTGAKQNLEMITYDLYKIYVQNFDKFYIAVVLSGVVDAHFKSRLNDQILKFAKEIMFKSENADVKDLRKKIAQYFDKI